MILPDVNVLVYAFKRESPDHERWSAWLAEALGTQELALADAVLLGFARIVTHPRIWSDPAPAPVALDFLAALRGAPRARPIGPTAATWACMGALASDDELVRGNLVPDAWLAALAISHGCRLATADRGFGRFAGLAWFRPLAS